jgi:hypothetical protein
MKPVLQALFGPRIKPVVEKYPRDPRFEVVLVNFTEHILVALDAARMGAAIIVESISARSVTRL